MNLAFQNQEIMQDSLAFLVFFIQNYHFPSSEKDKLKRMVLNIFAPLFEQKLKTFDFDENTYKDQLLAQRVFQIENSIFDNKFSFFSVNSQDLDCAQKNQDPLEAKEQEDFNFSMKDLSEAQEDTDNLENKNNSFEFLVRF